MQPIIVQRLEATTGEFAVHSSSPAFDATSLVGKRSKKGKKNC